MKRYFWNWLPALLTMGIIFWFSSQPSTELPDFNWADRLVKKSGHVAGYTMLAFWYWYGLGRKAGKSRLVWLLAIAFAVTDEFHQSFVFGRNASAWDVVIFDNLGILIGLYLTARYIKQTNQPNLMADSV